MVTVMIPPYPFFNLTPCNMVEIQQRFRRTRYLHLQGSERKIDAAISTNILQISRLPIISQRMMVDVKEFD